MTVLDVLRLLRTNIKEMVALALLGLLLAYAWTWTRPTVYEATATGIVTAGGNGTIGADVATMTLEQSKAAMYAQLVPTKPVLERVVRSVGPGVPVGALTPSTGDGSNILTITASGPTAQSAQDVANAAMGATAKEATKLETGSETGRSSIQLVPLETAQLPSSPSSPNLPLNLLAGVLGGIALALGLGLLRRRIDSRIRVVSDVEQITGVGAAAVIPESKELADQRGGRLHHAGSAAEAVRHLRTNLRFIDVDSPPRSVVITSANQGEGKSTISTTLAHMLAAAGQPTVLVDADLRRPNVATLMGLDGSVGLTQVLSGDVTLDEALQEVDQEGLTVLTAGRIPPNPSELLGSQRMHALIEELSRDSFVILDAPPLLPVTDAGLLAAQADGAFLVLRVGKTHREQAELCRKILQQVGARLLGTVLNRAPKKDMGTVLYGYGYGYGTYHSGYGYGYGRGAYDSRGGKGSGRRSRTTRGGGRQKGGQGRRRRQTADA